MCVVAAVKWVYADVKWRIAHVKISQALPRFQYLLIGLSTSARVKPGNDATLKLGDPQIAQRNLEIVHIKMRGIYTSKA